MEITKVEENSTTYCMEVGGERKWVPKVEGNRHYQDIQKWIDADNKPTPIDEPAA